MYAIATRHYSILRDITLDDMTFHVVAFHDTQ